VWGNDDALLLQVGSNRTIQITDSNFVSVIANGIEIVGGTGDSISLDYNNVFTFSETAPAYAGVAQPGPNSVVPGEDPGYVNLVAGDPTYTNVNLLTRNSEGRAI